MLSKGRMRKTKERAAIRLRGVRQNNLRGLDLDLPLGRLIVVTGPSGSGKSSLAFDTLFAEGQRRYIETFSPYARQFFDRMDRPQADEIEGMPPAIAIEQRNTVRTTRSTVGTMTEICDYARQLWFHLARLHCRQCGRPVRRDSPGQVWEAVSADPDFAGAEVLVTFDVPVSDRLSVPESLALVVRQGYQRLWVDGQVIRVEEAGDRWSTRPEALTIVQDRLRLGPEQRARMVEACSQAYHFGHGRLAVRARRGDGSNGGSGSGLGGDRVRRFSSRHHCAECDIEYREPTAALFSFNHPLGACPACRGFGRQIVVDYERVIPDRRRTLAEGVVRPWWTGKSAECQADLLKFCRRRGVPVDVPFERLDPRWQQWVIEGDPGYGQDSRHEWPHAWYGVRGYFRWLESKSYKMHVRVLLSRYRAYQKCAACGGSRFQPEAMLYRLEGQGGEELTLAGFYSLPAAQARGWIERLAAAHTGAGSTPLGQAMAQVRARLDFLDEVGLGYLTLDRPTRTLSGGETERVNLTACLGTELVNTLFVLDEPSVGLHPRDVGRLITILERLRDLGNTVVVVEHEASVMRAADVILDLGPGAGENGGRLMFQGPYRRLLRERGSLTADYLAGRRRIEGPARRPVELGGAHPCPVLGVRHATRHNLRDVSVDIPLGRLVVVTGVSGSGKTTLIRELLVPELNARLNGASAAAPPLEKDGDEESEPASDGPAGGLCLAGAEQIQQVILVDQSCLGRTPRSNPAVYIGAFDDLRAWFAMSDGARRRGLDASAFSFNSPQGQCERCRGAGFEKIEMQFLSDIFIQCPDCQGRRYRPHILEVRIRAPGGTARAAPPNHRRRVGGRRLRQGGSRAIGQGRGASGSAARDAWSIADLLESTVTETMEFMGGFPLVAPIERAQRRLRWLVEMGLGYLRLGQPINTLSGGESQRLKLVRHMAESDAERSSERRPALFVLDEPTTGLHFDDVRQLLQLLQRLVAEGQSLVVVEHNLDVIRCADWVIDLGPEGGGQGGQVVAVGPPEAIAACPASHTGAALREAGLRPGS